VKDKLLNALYEISNEHVHLIFLLRTGYSNMRNRLLANQQRDNEKILYEITIKHLLSKFSNEELNPTINGCESNLCEKNSMTDVYKFYNQDMTISTTHRIVFTHLYPNVLVKLYKNNLVKFNNQLYGSLIILIIESIDKIKSEISNKENPLDVEDYLTETLLNENTKYLIRFIVNFTYYISAVNEKFRLINHPLISRYTKNVFDELIDTHHMDIVSINVDEILLCQDGEDIDEEIKIVLNKLELPYRVDKLNYKRLNEKKYKRLNEKN